jgi:UDP-N-acetylmuramyl pentapeptide phosphotransferase/UDP-N-acetylglucosamine-1-phosphate transferase
MGWRSRLFLFRYGGAITGAMDLVLVAAVFVAASAAAGALTWLVLLTLRRRAILDHPNERSSHSTPTPRGGGIAVMAVVIAAAVLVAAFEPAPPKGLWHMLGGIAILAVVSWRDDLRSLSAMLRLTAQAAAVVIGLSGLPSEALVFQGALPLAADRVVAALLWIWFVNLFNFMDGIDGIAGSETVCITAGLVWLATVGRLEPGAALLAAATGGAALGFLWWNWQPARIFLGDVGSVPLGYLIGWLLIGAAAAGAWAAALILPLYYLADATITLGRRAARGEAVWRAHRDHFYQRAVQGGLSHGQVVRFVVAGNVALIGLAVVAESGWRLPALLAALVVVGTMLLLLNRPKAQNAVRRS